MKPPTLLLLMIIIIQTSLQLLPLQILLVLLKIKQLLEVLLPLTLVPLFACVVVAASAVLRIDHGDSLCKLGGELSRLIRPLLPPIEDALEQEHRDGENDGRRESPFP